MTGITTTVTSEAIIADIASAVTNRTAANLMGRIQ
jgi:hypothetical protein